MADFSYLLTYNDTPFVSDAPQVVRLTIDDGEDNRLNTSLVAPRKFQPMADLMDEINRLIPLDDLNDFSLPSTFPGRNLSAIADEASSDPKPGPSVKVGQWYYPYGAGRFSVCRMLATADQAFAMLPGCSNPKPFVMKAVPQGIPEGTESAYTIETDMYMLPPRTLMEHGGKYDGLYLITLVDERYYFQGSPATLKPHNGTTWLSLIQSLEFDLGISITVPTIDPVYSVPSADSQFWVNAESAPTMLDAIAYNLGMQIVRAFDGSYSLQDYPAAQASVDASRGAALQVVRIAGGDIFNSGIQGTIQDFTQARNAIVPNNVVVTFPKYIYGDDPIPHFLNTRYENQRPSCWYEESFGDVYSITVPISGSNPPWQNGPASVNVSGLTGVSDQYIHTTAKALYQSEVVSVDTFVPINNSGLQSLAVQIAANLYDSKAASALDEVYPGTFNWTPEAIHDIIFTYSCRSRLASTRVMRPDWNTQATELQFAHHALANKTNTARGVGGPSVPQTWRDGQPNAPVTTLFNSMASGDFQTIFTTIDNLPTQNRWYGTINSGLGDEELIEFEGTSGLFIVTEGTQVGIVKRGVPDTVQQFHINGSIVTQATPNFGWGINSVKAEKMQWIFPSDFRSGGVEGINIVPQTQSVKVLCNSGVSLASITVYSGILNTYDSTAFSGRDFVSGELIWIRERNNAKVFSGLIYDGQFAGFSRSGAVAPLYLINDQTAGGLPVGLGCSGISVRDSFSGNIATTSVNSIASGDTGIQFTALDNFPTQNRWVASINSGANDNELMLMEGTSGGYAGTTVVGIATRGYAGTTQQFHVNGSTIAQVPPHMVSGTVLMTYEKMEFCYPQETSGNVAYGARIVPQTQSVMNLNSSGVTIHGVTHWSGLLYSYNPALYSGNQFISGELLWLVERNNVNLFSGKLYDGQFVGFSASGTCAPLYLVNEYATCGLTGWDLDVASVVCGPDGLEVSTAYRFYIQGDRVNDTFEVDGELTTRTDAYSGVLTTNQHCTAAAVSAGGTGYVVGDILLVSAGTGTIATELQVLTATGGVIDTVSVMTQGAYTVPPTNPVSVTGGTGASATFNLTFDTNPLAQNTAYRIYWEQCGYQNIVTSTITTNTVNFGMGNGNPLPPNDTAIVVAQIGACCPQG